MRRWPLLVQKIVYIGMATALLIYAAVSLTHLYQNLTAQKKDQLGLVKALQNYPEHLQVITCYHSSSLLYSLYFGNSWARFSFSSTLDKLYPNSLFGNNWARRFENFNGDTQPFNAERALLQGMMYTSDGIFSVGVYTTPIKSVGFESIYLLTKSKSEQAK